MLDLLVSARSMWVFAVCSISTRQSFQVDSLTLSTQIFASKIEKIDGAKDEQDEIELLPLNGYCCGSERALNTVD